jgi:uncharacterized membrane protein
LASIWLARKLTEDERSPMTSDVEDSAYEVLRRRYASGEIDAEYERRLAVLNRR